MLPAAVLLADYSGMAGTVEVSNRTEFRVRLTEVSGATPFAVGTPTTGSPTTPAASASVPNPGLDLVDIPELRVDLKQHAWEYTLDYSAFAIEPDMELGPSTPQVLESAALGAVWHDPRVRLGLTEYGQFGLENSAYLALASTGMTQPPGGAMVQPLTNPESIYYGASRTDLEGIYQLSRQWLGRTLLEYNEQGGLDANSRTILPVVQGPRAEAMAGHKVTRLDTVETRLSGAVSWSTSISSAECSPYLVTPIPTGESCKADAESAQLTETWRRSLTPHSEAWLGVGPGVVFARIRPEDPYTHAIYPVGVGGFQYSRSVAEVKTVLRLDLQVAPLVDVRTGIIDDRAQGALTLTVPIRYLKLTGTLSGTRSVDPLFTEPVTSVQGSFEAEYRVESYLSLGGGIRYAWQEQTNFGTFSTGLLFVQATFRAPVLRF
jgi:hypothetical protein